MAEAIGTVISVKTERFDAEVAPRQPILRESVSRAGAYEEEKQQLCKRSPNAHASLPAFLAPLADNDEPNGHALPVSLCKRLVLSWLSRRVFLTEAFLSARRD
eukprot:748856-Amphidinium_carterae.1